nr:hypothetical protein [Tanacetum cinerariifolium]
MLPQVTYQSPPPPIQHMTKPPFLDLGFVVPVFSPGDDLIACLNKTMAFITIIASLRNAAWYMEKAMLVEAQKARQMLDEEQLAFLVDPGISVTQEWIIIPYNVAFQTEDLDTYDSDCDDLLNAQVQQDSMILSVIEKMSEQMINHVNNWEKTNKEHNNESINAELKRYKERVKTFKQRLNIDLSSHEKMIDSQMDDMIKEKLALKEKGYKKKAVVINSDPLALVVEKTKVTKQKEKVVVSSNSKGSGADDFSELKNITALLAKAFNRRKFYSKPTNNNLRTSSTSQSANKKQEFVKSDDKKEDKKADEKKRDMSKTKMLLAKKDNDEQVLLAKDQAWMESNSDPDQEINANMVFMAQTEKVLPESDESSSSAEETIAEVTPLSLKVNLSLKL